MQQPVQKPLDEITVRHVAELARLNLSDQELKHDANHLSRILDYISQLNELDTTDVVPTTHAISVRNVLREDEIMTSLTTDQAIQNAPLSEDHFFKVPKVLNQESA